MWPDVKQHRSDPSEPGSGGVPTRLFDFCFPECDVLADDGVIFPHFHLTNGGARILLCHVEISGIRCRNETNLDDVCFSHVILNTVSVCPTVKHGGIVRLRA